MTLEDSASGASGRPIAVLGASGQVGGAVVDALLTRGALVRRILRAQPVQRMAGDTLVAQWTETDLARAFSGCRGAFLMVPLAEHAPQLGLATHGAAEAAGLKRVVRLSVLQQLARDDLRLGRLHQRLDDDLHGRGFESASLCPDSFMQNLLPVCQAMHAGQLPNVTGAGTMSFIDVADIGETAAALLCQPSPIGGRHDLTGPQALSMPDVAKIAGRVLGRPIACQPQTVAAWRAELLGYGMPEFVVDTLCEVSQWTLDGHVQPPTPAVEAICGRPPKSMAEFLQETLRRD